MNSSLQKLFQSVININSQNGDEQQQQQQQQQQAPTSPLSSSGGGSSNTISTEGDNNNNDNVMRFFNKLNGSGSNINTLSPQPEQKQGDSSSSSHETPRKSSKSIGGVLPNSNLNFESSIQTPTHNGVYLSGGDIRINTSEVMKQIVELESQTITIIPSTIKYIWGRLISVSNQYICYVVKGEKIRVLERSSTQRALIKDIAGTITDMQFYGDASNLLCCATDLGMVSVYEIAIDAGSSEIVPKLIASTKVKVTKQCLPRVSWSPNGKKIVVAGNGVTAITVIDSTTATVLSTVSIPAEAQGNVNSLTIDSTGSKVAYGGSNGVVGVFDLSNGTKLFESTTNIADKDDGNSEITFLSFLQTSNTHLIIGSSANRVIRLVKIQPQQEITTIQKIVLDGGANASPLLASYIDSFLFLTVSSSSVGYVLHFDEQSDVKKFDFVSEFDVKKPVLSYTVKPVVISPKSGSIGGEELRGDRKFNIYSVQGHAVLFHSIQLSQSYLVSDVYQVENQIITQTGTVCDGSVQNGEEPLLTPGKLLIPSSPPPLALPDPSLLSVDTIQNGTLSPGESSDNEKNTKPKQEKVKRTKTTPSKKEAGPLSPKVTEDSASTSSPSFADQLLSPAALLQQQQPTLPQKKNSPKVEKKEKEPKSTTPVPSPSSTHKQPSATTTSPANTSSPPVSTTPPPPQVTTPSTTTTPVTTTPTTATTVTPSKSKTPSIRPAAINFNNQTPASTSSTSLPTTTSPASTAPSSSTTTTTTISTESIEKLLTKQFQHLENTRIERDNQEKEKQEQLLTIMHQTIQNTVKSQLEKLVKKEVAPIVGTLEKSLNTTIEQMISKALQESVKKLSNKSESMLKSSLEGVTSQLKTNAVVEAIELAVKSQVENVFMDYFSTILVPGFEKSCTTMFKHLSTTIDKAMIECLQQYQLSLQAQHLSIQKQLSDQIRAERENSDMLINSILRQQQQMANDMKTLMAMVAHQQQQQPPPFQPHQPHISSSLGFPSSPNQNIMGGGAGGMDTHLLHLYSSPLHNPGMVRTNSSSSFMDQQQQQQQQQSPSQSSLIKLMQYPELKVFVDSGNYANAFNFALNAANLTMVVDLCSVLEPTDVFAKKNLHNATIISLIQQLSYDLNTEIDLKLKWLKESIFQLDPNHPSVVDIAKRVLHPLKLKIESSPILLSKDYYTQPILSALKLILK